MKRYFFEISEYTGRYIIYDRERGYNTVMARCAHVDDAQKIVDALNATVPA